MATDQTKESKITKQQFKKSNISQTVNPKGSQKQNLA
jgi:hypothetical protein